MELQWRERRGPVVVLAGGRVDLRVVLLPLVVGLVVAGPAGGVIQVARGADACSSGPHPGGDWPLFGRDLANTRYQDREATIGPQNVGSLEPAWTFSVAGAGGDGTFESTPMVAGGCVFIATQTGWIFALDADDGSVRWSHREDGTVTTLAVAGGRVFATVSRIGSPRIVALDQHTGLKLWDTVVDAQPGSDITGSPVAFGDVVMTGISCIGAEGASGPERLACRGSYVLVHQAGGQVLAKGYGIPDEDFARGYAGGGIWAAPAVDLDAGYAYVGAGNPFGHDHPRAAALLKIDVDPSRPTFGQVVDSYKGSPEQYLPVLGPRKPACEASGYQAAACEFPDLDMAMAANLFEDSAGHRLVGTGQSSGVFHTVSRDTMELYWTTLVGPPTLGGRGGGSAYDGRNLYTIGGSPGQVWALEKDFGNPRWAGPTLDGVHSWNPVAAANGVVYTPNERDVLLAFDAATGQVLLARPMTLDVAGDVLTGNLATGVSVARNTVFAPANGTTGGHLIAYRLP